MLKGVSKPGFIQAVVCTDPCEPSYKRWSMVVDKEHMFLPIQLVIIGADYLCWVASCLQHISFNYWANL